ncbi:hypothetical protein [Pseudogemmobacter sonorensis]|uniref:hypothetical protein n=1 Tax=Pseudogemmobacter sonorensis TaxID=2989681 RepID=UPI0036D086F0
MKTRIFPALIVPVVLLACAPRVPDSGAGVGFQDYNSYIRGAQTTAVAPATVSTPAPVAAPGGFDVAAVSAALDGNTGSGATSVPGPLPPVSSDNRPRGNAPAGIQEQTGELVHSNPRISDENDFDAVASRESIESDADRIARNRSQYVVVQPRDLPQRPGDTGPNIVAFALATTHDPGTQMYSRSGLGRKDPNVACAKYASPDLAQQDFMARGGPERDRQGLDPDGDGFACGWDPRPFRAALQ